MTIDLLYEVQRLYQSEVRQDSTSMELYNMIRASHQRITLSQLRSVLINKDGSNFSDSTVKLILDMFGKSSFEQLEYLEFIQVSQYLLGYLRVFQTVDLDRSGSISLQEYSKALQIYKFGLFQDTIDEIFVQFTSSKSVSMNFDLFLESMVWCLKILQSFSKYELPNSSNAVLSLDDLYEQVVGFSSL
ncbi:unnamed protein product [Kuraishia capsulata CBS 1993]|uniref:EF-hand domain-containing protein n=1 Tax=Kuraishia capsulata CBS 1993 TaxID=1382522 RepID=W6MSN1_9ASCO|nr:uncharacterized protein KUCA_T00005707001 [Kuraishia capsulata CBS 1993]CDK29714.1 unnamed protein product [Kuraishia capsulata CBS 1993]